MGKGAYGSRPKAFYKKATARAELDEYIPRFFHGT